MSCVPAAPCVLKNLNVYRVNPTPMKKVLLTIALTGTAVSLLAQGMILFNNFGGTGTASYRFPIYGPEVMDDSISKLGNTTAGRPGGTQVYTGPLLAGPGFSAQLFAAPGVDVDPSLLVAALPISPFRTGGAAGFIPTTTPYLSNVLPDAPVATVQLRVWDNQGGLYPTWAEASAAWDAGLTVAGMSVAINVYNIGGGLYTPPTLLGMESFNIYRIIPEPAAMALAGLGVATWAISRRRR